MYITSKLYTRKSWLTSYEQRVNRELKIKKINIFSSKNTVFHQLSLITNNSEKWNFKHKLCTAFQLIFLFNISQEKKKSLQFCRLKHPSCGHKIRLNFLYREVKIFIKFVGFICIIRYLCECNNDNCDNSLTKFTIYPLY
jgi:hypothetical protein